MEKFTYKKMFENEKSFWWYVARRKIIANTLIKMKVKPGKVLELGSGTGGNVQFLSQFGQYTGIEKEQIAIDFARVQHPKTIFIKGELPNKLIEITDEYNVIVLLDVLEHIEDDYQTLKTTSKLLKEDGLLLITVPAYPSLWSSHDKIHHHFRRYTKKSLHQLCKRSGYKVQYHSFFNFFLFPLVVLIRTFKKIFRIQASDDKPTTPIINNLLIKIFGLESILIPKLKLPFGLSHIIILKKMTE